MEVRCLVIFCLSSYLAYLHSLKIDLGAPADLPKFLVNFHCALKYFFMACKIPDLIFIRSRALPEGRPSKGFEAVKL